MWGFLPLSASKSCAFCSTCWQQNCWDARTRHQFLQLFSKGTQIPQQKTLKKENKWSFLSLYKLHTQNPVCKLHLNQEKQLRTVQQQWTPHALGVLQPAAGNRGRFEPFQTYGSRQTGKWSFKKALKKQTKTWSSLLRCQVDSSGIVFSPMFFKVNESTPRIVFVCKQYIVLYPLSKGLCHLNKLGHACIFTCVSS